MKSIADIVTKWLVINKIICFNDKEIYFYGLQQGLISIINLFLAIVIGVIFDAVIDSVVFMCAYIPLRTFAGGYHAKTQAKCYIMSILQIVLSIHIIRCFRINTIYFLITMVCVTGIVLMSPVEASNKPLSQKEIFVYRNKSRKILFIELTIAVVCLLSNWINISKTIFTVCIMIFLVLAAGKLKTHIFYRNHL